MTCPAWILQHGPMDECCPPHTSLPHGGLVTPQWEVIPSSQCLSSIIGGEYYESVLSHVRLFQGPGNVPYCFIECQHHPRISASGEVLHCSEWCFILFRNLQGGVN